MMKLYVVVSEEAVKASNGNRGKMAAQCGHGFLHSYLDCAERFPERAEKYWGSGLAGKVVLKAPHDVVVALEEKYRDTCGVSLVTDAARTVFTEPTVTCIGIGPLDADEREEVLSNLKVWI